MEAKQKEEITAMKVCKRNLAIKVGKKKLTVKVDGNLVTISGNQKLRIDENKELMILVKQNSET